MSDVWQDLIERHTYTGTFTGTSGAALAQYTNLRALFLDDPAAVRERIREIAGDLTVAMPGTIGYLCASAGYIQIVVDTKARKLLSRYGMELAPVRPEVALIDDVRTTGNTLRQARALLEQHGITVVREACLMDEAPDA